MLIDQIRKEVGKFAFDFGKLGPNFATAQKFLFSQDFSQLPLGKTEIDGKNVYVNVMEYTQAPGEPAFEAHDRYGDIQLVLEGTERFLWGYGELGPLNEAKDKRTVKCENYVSFVLKANQFAIFLPGEAHAPNLPEDQGGFCRKAVVKVLVD